MKEILIVLGIILLAIVLLAGRGDQAAIDRAEAERVQARTQAEMAERAAAEARAAADWEATRGAVNWGKRITTLLVGCTLAVVVLFGGGVLVWRLWEVSGAVSRSFAIYSERRAELMAGAVRVDRHTRTWPALIAEGAVHNLETGEVILLAQARPADPQQVTASAQVRAVGVAAAAAAQIGKAARDGEAAKALPGVAGGVALVVASERISESAS